MTKFFFFLGVAFLVASPQCFAELALPGTSGFDGSNRQSAGVDVCVGTPAVLVDESKKEGSQYRLTIQWREANGTDNQSALLTLELPGGEQKNEEVVFSHVNIHTRSDTQWFRQEAEPSFGLIKLVHSSNEAYPFLKSLNAEIKINSAGPVSWACPNLQEQFEKTQKRLVKLRLKVVFFSFYFLLNIRNQN